MLRDTQKLSDTYSNFVVEYHRVLECYRYLILSGNRRLLGNKEVPEPTSIKITRTRPERKKNSTRTPIVHMYRYLLAEFAIRT